MEQQNSLTLPKPDGTVISTGEKYCTLRMPFYPLYGD